ncbi:MAG: HAMP domain-containing histidine kinase [Campylobacteraceae bacterium]|nr:HAMP domain-containing histidine kinase [Campylobacteraceae bacterium]
MLIVIFSIILYSYIKVSIHHSLTDSLEKEAANIIKKHGIEVIERQNGVTFQSQSGHRGTMELVVEKDIDKDLKFETKYEDGKDFLSILYSYDKNSSTFLKLTYDITHTNIVLKEILFSIMVINCSAIFLVIFHAFFLSRMLLVPIKTLNYKLSDMNENFLNPIDITSLPEEFSPLGEGINKLISRIQTFIKYQRELFIGIAHELKTPLAVMKTKNEVTLLKKENFDAYVEAIKKSNDKIDEMNKMISSVLEIGRQEGAQFEESVKIDLIKFLNDKAEDFKVFAASTGENKKIITKLSPKSYKATIQPTLLIHILQNFVQNALKFTKENGSVTIISRSSKDGFYVEVIDEGDGVDESKDFFAPFRRFGNKSGAGLGLFLAKGAAEAIGALISLKNRTDGCNGAIATLFIPKARKK